MTPPRGLAAATVFPGGYVRPYGRGRILYPPGRAESLPYKPTF